MLLASTELTPADAKRPTSDSAPGILLVARQLLAHHQFLAHQMCVELWSNARWPDVPIHGRRASNTEIDLGGHCEEGRQQPGSVIGYRACAQPRPALQASVPKGLRRGRLHITRRWGIV